MALFGINWEESKWPGHFCSIVLYFFASKIGVKLPPEKKISWHWCGAARCSRSNCHFFQKNAFFGQKTAFFLKVHFIQKCSVTPKYRTVSQWIFDWFSAFVQKPSNNSVLQKYTESFSTPFCTFNAYNAISSDLVQCYWACITLH